MHYFALSHILCLREMVFRISNDIYYHSLCFLFSVCSNNLMFDSVSGLIKQSTSVFRAVNIQDSAPQTPPSYQSWCKAVCLLHVGWGPDLGFPAFLVLLVLLPAAQGICLYLCLYCCLVRTLFVLPRRTLYLKVPLLL